MKKICLLVCTPLLLLGVIRVGGGFWKADAIEGTNVTDRRHSIGKNGVSPIGGVPIKNIEDIDTEENEKNDLTPQESDRQVIDSQLRHLARQVNDDEIVSIKDAWNTYPPHSRPLDSSAEDLIHYENIRLPFRPAVSAGPLGRLSPSAYQCRFQVKKQVVMASVDQYQSIIFECKDEAEQPVVMDVVAFKATGSNGSEDWQVNRGNLSVQALQQEGGALALEVLYQLEPDRWGDIAVEINYVHPNNRSQVLTSRAIFSLHSQSVAHFTNQFSERLVEGSLVIDAEIEVNRGGWYQFQANLKGEKDYIAASSYEVALSPGVHKVPFLFFGKIFHDKKATGAYALLGARGQWVGSQADHLLELSPEAFADGLETLDFDQPASVPVLAAEPFQTQAYSLSDFSSDRYR